MGPMEKNAIDISIEPIKDLLDAFRRAAHGDAVVQPLLWIELTHVSEVLEITRGMFVTQEPRPGSAVEQL